MSKKILVFISMLISLYVHAQDTAVKDYIEQYKELAIAEMIRTGVPASITIAQGILETQAGQSDLVKQSNNHFGIKCKTEWTGPVVYHDDDEKGECFRVYSCAADSYKDHSDFLKNRPNYAFLFNLDPTDYEAWAKGLRKAGYATSNVYGQMLIKLIVDYHLQDYTLLALQREKDGGNLIVANKNPLVEEPAPVDMPAKMIAKNPATAAKSTAAISAAQPVSTAAVYPAGAFTINGAKVIFAKTGSSLFALASNYNIPYKKLLEFNDLDQQDILLKDQLVFLAKKAKKGAHEFHIVQPGEAEWLDIAQAEGIRLENLVAFNHLSKNLAAKPTAGEKIYLQYAAPLTSAAVNTAFTR